METIFYRHGDQTRNHSGMWVEVAAGVVLMHTKHSQTLIPWHRVLRIEQSINPNGLEPHEIANKRLTATLRRN